MLELSTLSPAVWSAIAASCSALSSFIVMMIQRRNLLDAARPELVVTGWQRLRSSAGERIDDCVVVGAVKNVGRGPALTMVMNAAVRDVSQEQYPLAIMGTVRLPILAPGEECKVEAEISLWWKNIEAPFVFVTVELMTWDYRGYRHVTRYPLFITDLSRNSNVASSPIAEGVGFTRRETISRSVVWLRIQGRLSRLPVVRRWCPAP